MKRAGKLFDTLISDDNLVRAIDEVNRTHHWCKGHRPNTCTAWVEETKAERVKDLRRMLIKGFEPKPPHVSQRWDTSARKWRTISEPAQWPDQYVHHALIQALDEVRPQRHEVRVLRGHPAFLREPDPGSSDGENAPALQRPPRP